MPKRTDIQKILLIGSGPIVIGQACEFDYSGTQACKALREEGFEVVLVNSNPATIMTDPEMADRTYIEPLTPEVVAQIIARERPQALLPTLGGQTGLNLAVALAEDGTLERFGVELIGAKLPAIQTAEDRSLFKACMESIGLELPRSGLAHSVEEAQAIVATTGFPAILRPSFTLGGMGGSIARRPADFDAAARWALAQSPVGAVLIEESVLGWKEFELEVMRDLADNVVIICSIENFDPMGVHTGDSITVAPAQTLSDKEYQRMRDAAVAIIRAIGVETGGSNIQFAVEPTTGRMVVIEMNPRVSRSSALASKATGFPIAKIAAKLAVGYTLDELRNDITRETPASFEPTLDYCVVKMPRWAFEKFPEADRTLTTQMKSVGEAMAIGRTFKEALQKVIRSLEEDRWGLTLDRSVDEAELERLLGVPTPERLFAVAEACRAGWSVARVHEMTAIDPWFLAQIADLVAFEPEIARRALADRAVLRRAKQWGFADRRIAQLTGTTEGTVRQTRLGDGIRAVFKTVDTCAAEFVAHTPYLYSTYEEEDEAPPTARRKVVILGSGPNRIGQGIEFDYCCVHAAFALREAGVEAIMVNCNPETVSTDYDTSDRLYFEPLTFEDVLNIVEKEQPLGVVVQFGGQTPLKLAVPLQEAGVPILGTSPDAIDRAEDRKRFSALLDDLGLCQAPGETVRSLEQARGVAAQLGYPVLVRPSYVLGGRAMQIVHDDQDLVQFVAEAIAAAPDHPLLIDKFLEDALEVDVDAVSDGATVVVGGVMEHIEKAGIHSGDAACALPPYSLGEDQIRALRAQTHALARALGVVGLINVQFAIRNDRIYVLEVNPRASRTVPFVSKAIGLPLAKLATRALLGEPVAPYAAFETREVPHIAVKEAVFPFIKFPGVDAVLGPEMKSTGEVMGIDPDFRKAYLKSQIASGSILPTAGKIFVSVKNRDKRVVASLARRAADMGFGLVATAGTARVLERHGMSVELIAKIADAAGLNVIDLMQHGEIALVFNTPEDGRARKDSAMIRRTAVSQAIPYYLTIDGMQAALGAIEALLKGESSVRSLQEYHRGA
ncbi:MAG: carbamoyl-phosphate synthase large subunit [Candidatus Rokubacteria bacterium]|nr:carbamoyl-phosphate synthase large subunit [Candidatus Rokubacteria bacterium]MBI3825769.1 carbamoyl-phosphate synthase large subunit [Candidatus Rokubacteria bacterium]